MSSKFEIESFAQNLSSNEAFAVFSTDRFLEDFFLS
jgi:hypothetical protein